MKYFTIEELCKTSTGLDNTPGQLEISNLKNLVDHVLDPLRVKYGKPITINSGFRSLKVNKKVGGVSTSQHCLDEQSEILTSTGWKNVHTINYEDKLYTYNTNTNTLELCNIDNISNNSFISLSFLRLNLINGFLHPFFVYTHPSATVAIQSLSIFMSYSNTSPFLVPDTL